jgi:hypothetical protein
MPRYGTLNDAYLASWSERAAPGGPMWALNLMKYRAVAEYRDGRASTLSGAEADDEYAPVEQLQAVGARLILLAPVLHQLVGDDSAWDRVAIAQYPYRIAMIEMNMRDDFRKAHAHKEAGLEFTIVMATFPVENDSVPPQVSGADSDDLLLLQVVADGAEPDLAAGIESTRIGRFWVEDRFIGDRRAFAEARFDLISLAVADELVARGTTHDEANYVVIADPTIDDVARSLTDRTKVLL